MDAFFRSRMGHRFFESSVPRLIDEVGRLANGIAALNESLAQPAVTRRNWYQEREPGVGEHPIDIAARARLEDHAEYQRLRAQILELGGTLGRMLEGDALDAWLRIEAAFNDERAITAEAYYNAGVDAGLGMRVIADALAEKKVDENVDPSATLQALAESLTRFADRLK